MSFHTSCQNIHLIKEDGRTILHAEVRRRNNEMVARTFPLDRHIGNANGGFQWGGHDFSHSARDIELEQTERGPRLTAFLKGAGGEYRELQGLYLADRIKNEDGNLIYLN
ncbi:CVNH domain-containing protein [Aspergillus aculeatinus CBS 121060]|uniref:Cyanovirin-N n=3 Tax=Aspergillus TaxID=5052 RepID=A0A8G1VZC4_9EURO|nr:Cyanovirin-N [Aspergillus brunneoviolaceus CBS 621.78]XP_025500959.1 Cyanovirin-N [Aspergillus aculeatinus CBS 121060]XP_040802147.1 Cyanovirin-N [Aspergillus fijiensis CBS 313.89]RAH42397.1 Cyanovirin-N [Aspergillus brunneoviolaceus CBS 621.78]RAH67136.1 Cyanovirin-N [Aspergillus aculeatinus CBS 121060]RAK78137.1 Cyanovirin-N [Aspergillus fijiensis CBS 313.89]